MAVIALDLGGTKLAGAIFQPDGNLVTKKTVSLDKTGGNTAGRQITTMIQHLRNYSECNGFQIDSIGCCIPGIVYRDSGRVWAPNIIGWESFPLLDLIRSAINSGVNIQIDNDRACSILGEVWKGAAKGCSNAIFLAVGTGIGAGIIIDGTILRGADDIGGAIGWMAMDQPFQDKYKNIGCFEYHASGVGMTRIALEYLKTDDSYSGPLKAIRPELLTSHDIFSAYSRNDTIAISVVREAIRYWGMAVANLVSLFNPQKIIFGGGVFGPAVSLLGDIYLEAIKWAQPVSIRQVSLEASELAGDAGLTGAAFIALTGNRHV